jgi:hypothetical protein
MSRYMVSFEYICIFYQKFNAFPNFSQKRELDSFFTLEEMLLTRGAEDRSSLLSLIGSLSFSLGPHQLNFKLVLDFCRKRCKRNC